MRSPGRLPSTLLLVAAAAAGCAPRWTALDLGRLPDGRAYPEADAIVLSRELLVVFQEQGGRPVADETRKSRLRVLKEGGRRLASASIQYRPGFADVVDLAGRVVTPNGETRPIGPKDLVDQRADEHTLYQDTRMLNFDGSNLPLGSVVELEYTRRWREPQLFSFLATFGDFAPVLESRVEVRTPEGWEIEHAATEAWVPFAWPPETGVVGGERRSVWQRRDLPALETEVWSAGPEDRLPTLALRLKAWLIGGERSESFKDASDLSHWLASLYRSAAEPTPAIREKVQQILEGAPGDARERAARLYAWVQENVRYVAIEVGLGGWVPHPAADVLALGYGDCKDKAILLSSMLAVAGIDSRAAWLFAHEGYPRALGLPTIGRSNHTVLAVDLDAGPLIVDPTTRTVPFGELPVSDQEAELLLISEAGGARSPLIRAPASPPEANEKSLRLRLGLRGDRGAAGELELETTGAWSADLRPRILGASDGARRAALGTVARLVRPETLNAASFVDGPGPRRPLVSKAAVVLRDVLEVAAGARVLHLSNVVQSPAPNLPARPRTGSLVFPSRLRARVELRFAQPEGSVVSSLPEPVRLDSDLASYSARWSEEGGSIRVETDYQLKEHIIPAERYGAAKAFFDQVIAAEARGVVLRAGHAEEQR
jgi:hypothetical protein